VLLDGFTVQEVVGTPLLTSISLEAGAVGQSYTVGVSGKDTHFAKGTTAVSFGAGITAGTITVQSPTAQLVQINIQSDALVGLRTVKACRSLFELYRLLAGVLGLLLTIAASFYVVSRRSKSSAA
jgi:hypothetical protein